jgi:hypothetical protein
VRAFLNMHPPWAHGTFWLIWAITATVGPIAFIVSLLDGSGTWWIGLLLYIVALMTMAVDWLVVRWLQDHRPGWRPWEPPKWLHSA